MLDAELLERVAQQVREVIGAGGGDPKKFVEWALASVPNAVATLLEKNRLSLTDVDWVCPHQNVKTASEAWLQRIGVDFARVVETRKEYGNCGPASALLNLNRGAELKKFKHGDRILLFGQGPGMLVATLILRWHGGANPRLG
jgi:3-oxoacyl-[acyl-carrier-protein] synthase-3